MAVFSSESSLSSSARRGSPARYSSAGGRTAGREFSSKTRLRFLRYFS